MPQIETKYSGRMAYEEESVFDFPFGLPAFEAEKRFVFIDTPEYAPLVLLQSLTTPSLCFLAIPVLTADPNYKLEVSLEDRSALGLDPACQPQPGHGTLVLALVCLHDGFPATANLMAPIVVNVLARRALQAIRMDRAYSHQHPISAFYQHCEQVC